jgi:hypothetical protein
VVVGYIKVGGNKMINFIKRAWVGEVKLRWLVLLIILHFIIRLFYIGFTYHGLSQEERMSTVPIEMYLYFILMLPYSIWLYTSLWRAASFKKMTKNQSNWNELKYLLARILFFISVISLATDIIPVK